MIVGIDASNLRQGGGVTHLVELLSAADPANHGFDEVIVWGTDQTLSHLPSRHWLKCIAPSALNHGLLRRIVWINGFLARELHRFDCDILFVPGSTYTGSFRPFVTMSRNLLPFDEKAQKQYGWDFIRLRYWMLRHVQTKTFRDAAAVIFLTEGAKRAVERRTGQLPAEACVIPHGLSDQFHTPPRPQRRIEACSVANPFKLLYVSEIKPYKHHAELVHAVASLRRIGLPISLDLLGSGSPKRIAQLRIAMSEVDPQSAYLFYRGAIPRAELADHYRRADAFVFASSCETISNTLLEAMASGLPIASSAHDPMPEVLGEASIYFQPHDPRSIAKSLDQLIRDYDLRERLASNAYDRAFRFSWISCAAKTFTLLARVARSNAGAEFGRRL